MVTQADMNAAREEAAADAVTQHRIEQMEKSLAELRADRDKFLRWGVIVLGGAVVSLVTWIFNLLTRH